MTQEQISNHFEGLDKALKRYGLPCEDGQDRAGVFAGEFMLMRDDPNTGTLHFKHIGTRNYLHLNKDDTISIPTGGPFHLGFFDNYNLS